MTYKIIHANGELRPEYDTDHETAQSVADWLRSEPEPTDMFNVVELEEERRGGWIVSSIMRADFWLGKECRKGGCLYGLNERWLTYGGRNPTDKFTDVEESKTWAKK